MFVANLNQENGWGVGLSHPLHSGLTVIAKVTEMDWLSWTRTDIERSGVSVEQIDVSLLPLWMKSEKGGKGLFRFQTLTHPSLSEDTWAVWFVRWFCTNVSSRTEEVLPLFALHNFRCVPASRRGM